MIVIVPRPRSPNFLDIWADWHFPILNTFILGRGRPCGILAYTVREATMVFKLRKMFYSVSFWVSVFAAFVILHSAWALTH